MLYLIGSFILFVALVVAAVSHDPVGLGLLLSSHVGDVADARLDEPTLGIPPLYVVAAAAAGAGMVLGLPATPMLAGIAGIAFASFLLLTLWDMRRRRGTLAVYIRLRRAEIGFEPKGDVIEVPKLVFLVMNQPTPLIWLYTALAMGVGGALLVPRESWVALVPLGLLALVIVWFWLRNRRSPWERLARRLRWVSLRDGDRLIASLERALDLDPEVALLRQEADAVVMRFMTRDQRGHDR